MTDYSKEIEIIKNNIGVYPDFPKPGILFRDVFSVLKNHEAFQALHKVCLQHASSISPSIEAVAALESRGFLIGPLLALDLKVPFIPIRKKGKLPGKVTSVTFELEYGKDVLEIQTDQLAKGTKMLIVDDLLATGGTLSAGCKLLQDSGLEVVDCLVIMELVDLGGKSKVPAPVHSLIKY